MTTALLKDVPPLNRSVRVTAGEAFLVVVFLGDAQAPRRIITTNKRLTVFINVCYGKKELLSAKINRSILIATITSWIDYVP